MIPNVHPTAIIGGDAQWRQYLEDDEDAIAERTRDYSPWIHDTTRVGAYTVVDSGCVRRTMIGADVQLMCQVHVGHGARIGRGCDIATGTVIAGECTIGQHVKIGIGALITPFTTIGNYARIGAGSVVTKDVPAHECWAGNPARWLYNFCVECHHKIHPDSGHATHCMKCALEWGNVK